MKVREYYLINKKKMAELSAFTSKTIYYTCCIMFYLSVLDKDINALSEEQKNWLNRIEYIEKM